MDINKLSLFKHKKNRIGVAFGGGGARGFVHLGAIKAFEEYGLNFDFVCGTSVGSIAATFYSSGMPYAQIYQCLKDLDMKDLRTNKIPYQTSKTDGLENLIETNFGDINIEELKKPCAAVCVDLVSTKECVVIKGSLKKAVAGSCCLPYVFYPVNFEERHFVDGGMRNTIPCDVPKIYADCDYVVGIDANPTRSRGTTRTRLLDVLPACFRILMENNARKGYRYADVMVQPNTKDFSTLKIKSMDDLIEEGYRKTVDKIPEILALFNKKPLSKRYKKRFKEKYYQQENDQVII